MSSTGQVNCHQTIFPTKVATGLDNRVYVFDGWAKKMRVYENDGSYVTQWGGENSQLKEFGFIDDLSISKEGLVYILYNSSGKIRKFDKNGALIGEWGKIGSQAGEFNDAGSFAVSDNGHVYVVDKGNNRVQIFDANGVFIAYLGEDRLSSPNAVAAPIGGHIYIDDDNVVKVFDQSGAFLFEWGNGRTLPSHDHFAVSQSGSVYIIDHSNGNHLSVYDPNGNFISEQTVEHPYNDQYKGWSSDLAVSSVGQIFVSDAE